MARRRSKCAMACRARTFEVGLHWRRSLKGEVHEVSEGLQFEMVSKCRHFVSLVSTFWLSSPKLLCMSFFPMILCALVQSLFLIVRVVISLLVVRVVRWRMREKYTSSCYTRCALPCRPLKQLTRSTWHDLALFSSSLKLQTIKVSTPDIMVALTYCCTALQNYL
jgi:hypothetical protein